MGRIKLERSRNAGELAGIIGETKMQDGKSDLRMAGLDRIGADGTLTGVAAKALEDRSAAANTAPTLLRKYVFMSLRSFRCVKEKASAEPETGQGFSHDDIAIITMPCISSRRTRSKHQRQEVLRLRMAIPCEGRTLPVHKTTSAKV